MGLLSYHALVGVGTTDIWWSVVYCTNLNIIPSVKKIYSRRGPPDLTSPLVTG